MDKKNVEDMENDFDVLLWRRVHVKTAFESRRGRVVLNISSVRFFSRRIGTATRRLGKKGYRVVRNIGYSFLVVLV